MLVSIMKCKGLGPAYVRWAHLESVYTVNDCGELLEPWVEMPLHEFEAYIQRRQAPDPSHGRKKMIGLEL